MQRIKRFIIEMPLSRTCIVVVLNVLHNLICSCKSNKTLLPEYYNSIVNCFSFKLVHLCKCIFSMQCIFLSITLEDHAILLKYNFAVTLLLKFNYFGITKTRILQKHNNKWTLQHQTMLNSNSSHG